MNLASWNLCNFFSNLRLLCGLEVPSRSHIEHDLIVTKPAALFKFHNRKADDFTVTHLINAVEVALALDNEVYVIQVLALFDDHVPDVVQSRV